MVRVAPRVARRKAIVRAAVSWLVVALAAATCVLAACHRPETLLVSAAISLKEPLERLARAYEHDHPGARVALNLAASGALARQIEARAPVDVYASADERTMQRLAAQQLVEPSIPCARNRLVLVARKGTLDGARFATLATDPRLTRLDRVARVAIGQPDDVPAGHYAAAALRASGQWDALAPRLVYGASVRAVLDYVARGEADAGFVYATDVAIAPGVVVLDEVPPDPALPIVYPIAVVQGAPHAAAARAFVDLVTGPVGRKALADAGFLLP